MPLRFEPLAGIPDVVRVVPEVFADDRGWFFDVVRREQYLRAGLPGDWAQDSHSRNDDVGVVRGLHYQAPPVAQGKLVRCIRGALYDVAVDLRQGSSTFGRHVHVTLEEERHEALWIPPGFAHGFCVTRAPAEILYKMTKEYSPAHERRIRWDDPDLAIAWPVKGKAVLSTKDAQAPTLREAREKGSLPD